MSAKLVSSLALTVTLAACGGSSSESGAPGGCTPGTSASIAISASGVSPKAVCVKPGGTVTFTNNDTAAHDIESGATCTALNLGAIAAAGTATATFPTAQTCTFHDQGDPSNTAFQGTVAVSSGQVTGPGY
ncbi:MAG: hypothetical protein QM704_22205 [Anaeromyxobacteraceae bacterium]